MKKIRVYVAGAYSKGDPCINTKKAIDMADELLKQGFIPFIPHLCHFWHTMSPKKYDDWIQYDLQWLKVCDAMLVISESKGVNIEKKYCIKHSIPIFYNIGDMLKLKRRKNEK